MGRSEWGWVGRSEWGLVGRSEWGWVGRAEWGGVGQNMQLSPVPASVQRELTAYKAFRQSEFNRFRQGSQVVDTTVDGDCANALRFLGYVKQQFQQAPSVKLFASPRVGEWTQSWLEQLRTLGLKASSLACYTNGVIAVCGFALTLVEDPDACPVAQLINLRRASAAHA